MRCEAITTCFVLGNRQRPGSQFDIPDEPTREANENDRKLGFKGALPLHFNPKAMRQVSDVELKNQTTADKEAAKKVADEQAKQVAADKPKIEAEEARLKAAKELEKEAEKDRQARIKQSEKETRASDKRVI